MFSKILVANRGAVASRIIRAAKEMGIKTVAVFSEADCDMPYLAQADQAFSLGEAAAAASYLNIEKLIAIATATNADGVHPGYGFLSENPVFAAAVERIGAAFIGPPASWIDRMGHKTRARDFMRAHGMPMLSNSPLLPAAEEAVLLEARRLGFPVIVKPAAGGGGIGMQIARREEELLQSVERARSLASRSFSNPEIYLEPLVERPRHIEIQILADRYGAARHLFERDCSIQRRHQKIIEEAPAPGISRSVMDTFAERSARIMAEIGYQNIGTIETLHGDDDSFNFLEMNTRLQVEHAVTEAVTGIDIVKAQIRLAWGDELSRVLPVNVDAQGAAIEARIYAEDPVRFLPSPGPLRRFRMPTGEGIRVETGYAEGTAVTPFYDPMLAKIIAHGRSRAEAVARIACALNATEIEGVRTNIPFLQAVLGNEDFLAGNLSTDLCRRIQDEQAVKKKA